MFSIFLSSYCILVLSGFRGRHLPLPYPQTMDIPDDHGPDPNDDEDPDIPDQEYSCHMPCISSTVTGTEPTHLLKTCIRLVI